MGLSNETADRTAKEDVTCEKMTSDSVTLLRYLCPEQVIAMTSPNKNYKLKIKNIYLIFLYLAE